MAPWHKNGFEILGGTQCSSSYLHAALSWLALIADLFLLHTFVLATVAFDAIRLHGYQAPSPGIGLDQHQLCACMTTPSWLHLWFVDTYPMK